MKPFFKTSMAALLGLAALHCSDDGSVSDPAGAGGAHAGTGGAVSGTGGLFVPAAGGAFPGTGGLTAGAGGLLPGMGGAFGVGGSLPDAGSDAEGAGGDSEDAGADATDASNDAADASVDATSAGGSLGSGGNTSAGGNPGAGGDPGAGGASSGGASAGGASSGGASAGGASSGGASAGGASSGGSGGADPVGNDNRAPGFIDLTPPLGAPLPVQGAPLTPAPPAGWQYHPVDGAVCRDGTPLGIYVHRGTVNELVIYFEGGGAVSNKPFGLFSPKAVAWSLDGDGASVLGSTAGAVQRRQQPGVYSAGTPQGIFDDGNAQNPFRDWHKVYVPYCTGDVHYGSRPDGTVPGTHDPFDARSIATHQFLGAANTRRIIGRVYPTFSSATRVVVTGSSAGSFGAALNYSMIQDTFGNTRVLGVLDSGIPFDDQYMPTCMQSRWRSGWGLDFPDDCTECQQANGGGLVGMADFLLRKHPNARVAVISTMQDQVIRLFFSVGLNSCSNYDAGDPVAIFLTVQPYMPGTTYDGALRALRTRFQPTNRMATFYLPGDSHQHVFRSSFYTSTAGGKTMAQFVSEFLSGTTAQLGP